MGSTPRRTTDLALMAVVENGHVELQVSELTRPVGEWLDELVELAADEHLEITWTLRGDVLSIIDIEA